MKIANQAKTFTCGAHKTCDDNGNKKKIYMYKNFNFIIFLLFFLTPATSFAPFAHFQSFQFSVKADHCMFVTVLFCMSLAFI